MAVLERSVSEGKLWHLLLCIFMTDPGRHLCS